MVLGTGWLGEDIGAIVAVVAGGGYEEHIVFRRCATPEKIRIVRTEGNNSGEMVFSRPEHGRTSLFEKVPS